MRQNDEVRDDVDEKADGASERTNDYSGRIEETNIERKVEAKSNCLLSQTDRGMKVEYANHLFAFLNTCRHAFSLQLSSLSR